MKVAVISMAEMGHFLPMLHIAEELTSRGHDVAVVTYECNRQKCELMLSQAGVKGIITNDGISKEAMTPGDTEANPQSFGGFQQWMPFLKKELETFKPDIAVIDFFTVPGFMVCEEMGIPVVSNIPMPIGLVEHLGHHFPSGTNSFNCLGSICIRQTCFSWLLKNCLLNRQFPSKHWKNNFNRIPLRVQLVNSFWGFDQPQSLPPNFIMTGPLMKSADNLLSELERKDPKLFAWMNEAQASGQKIVYLSLGSMCGWRQWEVNAFYQGCKKLGVRVIWSIRADDLIKDINDPMFWISKWVPQVELLSHPAVCAGLTHCGFGGTVEFINAGVPMILLPHFGDQGPNAEIIIKRGLGIPLIDPKIARRGYVPEISFDKEVFTAEKVHDSIKELMDNQLYKRNILKMQKLCKASGGRTLAAETIESVHAYGSEHLIDKDFYRKSQRVSCLKNMMSLLIILGLIVFIIIYMTI